MLKKLQLNIRFTKKQKYAVAFILTLIFSVSLFFLQEKLVHLKALGLIGLFLISVVSSILFLPSPLLIAGVLASGHSYSPLIVALVASSGSAVGDIVSYAIGYTGREAFWDNQKWHHQVAQEIFNKFGGLFIFVLALIPNPFIDAIGVFAGLFLYPLKKFFIYVLIGRFIRNILLAYIGSSF